MNLNEIRAKFIDYLSDKGKINEKEYAQLAKSSASIFLFSSEFANFIKDNYSELGIKNNDKMPTSISEILEMINEEDNDEKDTPEEKIVNNSSSTEISLNRSDGSKNYIKSIYDSLGNLKSQEISVNKVTGTPKSKYITEFDDNGGIRSEFQMEYGTNIDQEIGYSEQGEMGDCWLLASLNSLSYTDAGKDIIKKAISKNDDGTYTINFKGVDTKINITPEELEAAKKSEKYSTKDDDMLLFELGFESIIKKIESGEIKVEGEHPGLTIHEGNNSQIPLNGGNLEDAIFLLTGKDVVSEFKPTGSSTNRFDTILSSLKDNPGKFAAMIGISAGESPLILKDINGNEICTIDAGTSHAFSIKSVDEDGVTIVNPWDSSKEFKISLADARKFATGIQYFALDDSFTETNSLDSNELDNQDVQSTEENPSTETPSTPDVAGPSGASGPSNTSGPSGGSNASVTPTPSADPTQDPEQKDITKMSVDELNTERNSAISDKNVIYDEMNKIANGEGAVAEFKTAADEAYKNFQTALKEKDSELAEKYDKAKINVDDKQKLVDENDIAITKKESEQKDAEADLDIAKKNVDSIEGIITNLTDEKSSIENNISNLKESLSSAKEEEKASIIAQIKNAEAQLKKVEEKKTLAESDLETAKQAVTDAETALNTIKEELEELKGQTEGLKTDLQTAKDELAEIESEVSKLTEADPDLAKLKSAYDEAQKTYESKKTEAMNDVKSVLKAQEDYIDKIAQQIPVTQAKENEKKYKTTSDTFGENVKYEVMNGGKYITDESGMKYLVIGPQDADPTEELPMLVYLHGSGEVGGSESTLLNSSLPRGLTSQNEKDKRITDVFSENFRGYILLPVLSNGNWCNNNVEQQLRSVINNFTTKEVAGSKHSVDSTNIALSGHSLGGSGAAYMAVHMEDIFSRVCILSGYNPDIFSSIKKPVFGYYGTSDSAATYMTSNAAKAALGNNIRSVSSNHGSVPWNAMIRDDDNSGRSDYFEWLFPDK